MDVNSRSIGLNFARAVIAGLRLKGHSDASLSELIGVDPVRLAKLAAGEIPLSQAMRQRIERAVGLTTGQIAALSVDPDRKGLAQLMDELAAIGTGKPPHLAQRARPSPPSKRPSAVARRAKSA